MTDAALTAADLVKMFEASEEASIDARAESERCRDYVDGKQLTAEELATLAKRGQPPVIINRIKRKVDFLRGFEIQQRVKPRAWPRTPLHEGDATAASQALEYVTQQARWAHVRSKCWDNLVVEGTAAAAVRIEMDAKGEPVVRIQRYNWDRLFFDPHSVETDFSDASYLGTVQWLDYDEALRVYPDGEDALTETLATASTSDTYDDKPAHMLWADKARKRVRICQIWIKRGDDWHFAEFTKGGILKSGASPYTTDEGGSDCELIFVSSYVARDGARYGLVQEMLSPQDEINKRRSKALHLLSTAQIVYRQGSIDDRDIPRIRREAARPDGVIAVNGEVTDLKFETRSDLATGQFSLLQEAKNEIDQMAGNIALTGNAVRSAASGKAIIASQQGGAMEIAPIMDALRDFDTRLYRTIWNRIRQYWTGEKWLRVTDDQKNLRWVVLNPRDPATLAAQMQNNPAVAERIAGVVNRLAELDCDIILEDAPDNLTPALEQFQALVELKKYDAGGEIPFRAIVEAAPDLRNKERILALMDERQKNPQAAQMQQQMQALTVAQADADVKETQASAFQKISAGQKALAEIHSNASASMVQASNAFDQYSPPPG